MGNGGRVEIQRGGREGSRSGEWWKGGELERRERDREVRHGRRVESRSGGRWDREVGNGGRVERRRGVRERDREVGNGERVESW